MALAETQGAIDAVWRIESPRLIAGLTRIVRDVGLAEDLAQDALVAALEQWPESGVPRNPGAWLMTVGKRRAIDLFRRNRVRESRYAQIGRSLSAGTGADDPDLERIVAEDIDDDLLRLVFVSCHPVLPMPARVALTLRLLGGLTTVEIARAYLVSEPTIAQRIVRAKRTLTKAGVPFEVPGPSDRAERLASVLDVIYLIYNEGYSATAGEDWMRLGLCLDALRLGRTLVALLSREAEVDGLGSLVQVQAGQA